MPATSNNVLTNSFKGFESLFTQWRMFIKMTFYIIAILLVVQMLIFILIMKYHPEMYFRGFTGNDRCIFQTYLLQNIRFKIFPGISNLTVPYNCEGRKVDIDYAYFESTFKNYYEKKLYPIFKQNLIWLLIITGQIYWLYIIAIIFLSKKHRKSTKDTFIRGKVFVDDSRYSKLLIPYDTGFKIHLNNKIFISDEIVSKHHFIIGATGSGKSQLANRIIDQLINENCRCIIHDSKGDMIPTFYDEKKHYIFNPIDLRHMGLSDHDSKSPRGWSIFNELETLPNVDAFASSMIPNGQGDPIWFTAPRDLLKAMIYYCIKNKRLKNSDLLSLIETPPNELRKLFDKTPGCKIGSKHLEEGKLAGQFMSILATYTASLQYLTDTDGDFSIRKWIADPNSEKRIIFLSNQAEVQETLKTLISTFFDFSIKALCTLPDDPEGRRIHFLLEEFGQLSKMNSVVQLLTQGRSKGAASWLFIQDMGQIDHIYGRDLSKTIVNGCRSKYYFNVTDYPTAEFISKEIGTVEFKRTKESKSFGVSDLKDSISINDEIVEKPIALPSQITSQKPLSFYLQLSDIPEITHTEIKYRKYESINPAYLPRDIRVSTYGESQNNQTEVTNNSESKIQTDENVLTEQEIEEQTKITSSINLYKEMEKLPLKSDETPVDESEIPDLSGARFIPIIVSEKLKNFQEQQIQDDQINDYQERVNF